MENRGNADLRTLQEKAAKQYEQAREMGRLMVAHPITGKGMPAAEFQREVQARHALRVKASEFWSAPLSETVSLQLDQQP